MRPAVALLLAVFTAPLGGCYHAVSELISAEEAVFPFTKLTYRTDDDDEQYTLVRKGSAYVDPDDESAPEVRFRELRPGLYLAQGHFVIEEASFYAAATVRADLDQPQVELYAGFADVSGPPVAELPKHGFAACDHLEGMICLDGAASYVTFALGLVDAGAKPDKTFEILSYE
jgi:hypothetical protein